MILKGPEGRKEEVHTGKWHVNTAEPPGELQGFYHRLCALLMEVWNSSRWKGFKLLETVVCGPGIDIRQGGPHLGWPFLPSPSVSSAFHLHLWQLMWQGDQKGLLKLPAGFPLLTSGPSITAGSVMVDMTSLINSTGISPDTRDLLASSGVWELFIFLFSPVMFKIKGKKTDGLKWKIWPDESNLFWGGNLGVRQAHVCIPGWSNTDYEVGFKLQAILLNTGITGVHHLIFW